MRYALLTDIHANLPALEAVLHAIEDARIDRIMCLGDIVGYGAWPAECVSLMRRSRSEAVMGNHDCHLTHPDAGWLAQEAKPAARTSAVVAGIRHARAAVGPEDLAWLASRPMVIRAGYSVFAHAALHGGRTWPYLFGMDDSLPPLAMLGPRMGFFGHTHKEIAFCGGDQPMKKRDRGIFRFPLRAAK